MAVTSVGICNSALVKMGASLISSLTETSREAQLCKALYETVRDETLRAHPWNFATQRKVIAPISEAPAFGYDYQYDIPNDCLRVLPFEDTNVDYVVEGRKILSNDSSLDLRYIYRNTDESEWDTQFAEAFSWKLARELAMALVQSAPLVEMMDKGFRAAIASARSVDGQEGIIKGLVADTWLNARY